MRRRLAVITLAALALTGCASGDDTDPTASPSQGETASPTPDEDPTDGGDGTDDEVVTDPDASPSPTPSDDQSASPSPTPTSDGDVTAMEFTPCETPAYTVPYPAEWQTNEPNDLIDACRVFHPEEIDLPDDPQDLGLQWAVTINIDAVPFEAIADGFFAGEVLLQRDITVDGRDALVAEYESEGETLVPEGELTYVYAVDVGGETLFARTTTVGDSDYDRAKQVLDRMMGGLELASSRG